MFSETEFHQFADKTLALLLEIFELADGEGALEPELEASGLSVQLPAGKSYLISKHAASKQLWVASPVSGGLHFVHQEDGSWRLKDGRELTAFVREEIAALSGIAL
jgi:frataxin